MFSRRYFMCYVVPLFIRTPLTGGYAHDQLGSPHAVANFDRTIILAGHARQPAFFLTEISRPRSYFTSAGILLH